MTVRAACLALTLCAGVVACGDAESLLQPSTHPRVAAQLQSTGTARLMLRLRQPDWTAPADLQGRVHQRSRRSAAISVGRAGFDLLQADPAIERIDLDYGGDGHLAEALPLAGFAALPDTAARGRDVSVALLDTGVDASHPDLTGRLAAEACFCSTHCCPGGTDSALGEGSAHDDNGHGTHLAATIVSQGQLGPGGGAPEAKLVAIKVLDSSNRLCCASDAVAALDWLTAQHPEVRVVNMSFGLNTLHAADCDGADSSVSALADAVDALRARGVLVIASSGNHGSSFSMTAPACIRSVLSVGATWDAALGPQLAYGCSEADTAADQIACFSNASPTTDLVAPGALITASWPGPSTLTRAGTSEASAVVAACAANLISELPAVSADALESALTHSGKSLTDTRNQRAYSALRCADALPSLRPPSAADSGRDAPTDADSADLDASLDAGVTTAPADAGQHGDAAVSGQDGGQVPQAGAAAGMGPDPVAGRAAPEPALAGSQAEASRPAPRITRAVRVRRPLVGSCDATREPDARSAGGWTVILAGLGASVGGRRRRRRSRS